MNRTGQHPPRTRAVAALDLVLGVLAVGRRLVLAPIRLATRPGIDRLMLRGVAIAAATVIVGTGVLVVTLLRTPDRFAPLGVGPEPDAAVESAPEPGRAGLGPNSSAGSAAPGTPSPSPSPSPSRPDPAAPPPGTDPAAPVRPAELTATYRTEQVTLIGYRAAVDITNPGRTPVDGWTVVITLPRRTLSIAEVSGATATQDGATWTFQPDRGTRRVPPDGTVRVTFRVDGAALGATAPTGCTIDGRPCANASPSPG